MWPRGDRVVRATVAMGYNNAAGLVCRVGSCVKPLEMAQWAALRADMVCRRVEWSARRRCNKICRGSVQDGEDDAIEDECVENGP